MLCFDYVLKDALTERERGRIWGKREGERGRIWEEREGERGRETEREETGENQAIE